MQHEIEHRAFDEIRAEGDSILVGVAVPYNRASQIGERFTEIWRPGSVGEIGEVRANVQHSRSAPLAVHKEGGGLSFQDTSTELRARIDVVQTANGADCLEMVRRGILTGLSAEFKCLQDSWRGRERTITSVELRGLAVVDVPGLDGAAVALEKRYKATEHRGAALIALLESALPDEGDTERPARIEAAATGAGIAPETMMGILRNEIALPPRERLVGFSQALDIPLDRLIDAAIEDGGSRDVYEQRDRMRRRLLWA